MSPTIHTNKPDFIDLLLFDRNLGEQIRKLVLLTQLQAGQTPQKIRKKVPKNKQMPWKQLVSRAFVGTSCFIGFKQKVRNTYSFFAR